MKKVIALIIIVIMYNNTIFSECMCPEDDADVLNPILNIPNTQEKFHCAGDIYFTITNWGTFGSKRKDNFSYDCIPAIGYWGSCSWFEYTCLPSAEYPGGSDIEYLYQGALWIGGVVEGDTIICLGEDGWHTDCNQLFPDGSHGDTIIELSTDHWDPGAISHQDFIATFMDTLTDTTYVPPEHKPMGIKITQKSYSWHTEPLDDMILFCYKLSNLGGSYIYDMYLGLYFDGDVGFVDTPEYAQDDITGFLASYVDTLVEPHDTIQVDLAWIADNDGDPEEGRYTERSPTGILAVKVLHTPGPNLNYCYNWWVSNVDETYDWGPDSWPFDPFDGTPEGLLNKYIIMGNAKTDYDQIEIGNYLNDTTLLSPPPAAWQNIQNGFDVRFLLSVGPFDLNPGDSVSLAFAVIIVDSFHTNPDANPDSINGDDLNFQPLVDLTEELMNFWGEFQELSGIVPISYSLGQNYPNPFNHNTIIPFSIPTKFREPQKVSLVIYDLVGKEIRNLLNTEIEPGNHHVVWNGTNNMGEAVPSGVYFYRISIRNNTKTQKCVLIK